MRAEAPKRRHSRVGSSSGSGGSGAGRSFSGTLRRFTRIRVQVEDLPRIASTKISSGASSAATAACFSFHRSRPASAACLSGEFATTISGILIRFLATDFAREGATLGASLAVFRKCGGQGASPSPAASSSDANSSNRSSEPAASYIPAWGFPIAAKRPGTVFTVNSAGSQPGTSSQVSGVETRASGKGRTEYAEQVVRSFAFWL